MDGRLDSPSLEWMLGCVVLGGRGKREWLWVAVTWVVFREREQSWSVVEKNQRVDGKLPATGTTTRPGRPTPQGRSPVGQHAAKQCEPRPPDPLSCFRRPRELFVSRGPRRGLAFLHARQAGSIFMGAAVCVKVSTGACCLGKLEFGFTSRSSRQFIKRCAVRLSSMDAAVARNSEHVTEHVTSTRPSIVGSCLGACRGPVPPHPFQGRLDTFIMHIEASPLRAPETASSRRVRERSACWR
jgi:hypothetical protein